MRLDLERPESLVGARLAGRFEVVRVRGQGGMGVVVAARHRGLGRQVAIKLLKDGAHAEAHARFRREASIAARLVSDRVARVSDADLLPDGTPFMVMELADGGSLADVLASDGAVPIAVAVAWVIDACEALAEAHARGVVHRDLKPSNLLLTGGARPHVKVSDFGVSADAGDDELTRVGATIGSPSYMSPEQIDDPRWLDGRSDLFALGVVLFELLGKARPFDARSVSGTLTRVTSHPPPDLAALRRDAPVGLVAVVERALAKRREERYQTALELASALAPFAGEGAHLAVARVARAAALPSEERWPGVAPARRAAEGGPATTMSGAGALSARATRAPQPSRGVLTLLLVGVGALAAWAWRAATARPHAASPVVAASSAPSASAAPAPQLPAP